MHAHASPPQAAAGFSLIELLVALAVFALVALALLNLAGESLRTANHVEQRTLAGIVAANLAVEAQLLDAQALARPARGHERLAGRDWAWQRTATPGAGEQPLLRVDIRVAGDDGREAASAEVYR